MLGEGKIKSIKDRFDICKECPSLAASKLGLKCSKCGCFISLKIAVKSQYCPIGKW